VAARTAESITQGVDLAGKTALDTGVNSGIGFETARVLALRGAKVLGTTRAIDKARDACSTIEGDTVPLACELTDRDSIRSCVAQVELLELPGIDIVVANILFAGELAKRLPPGSTANSLHPGMIRTNIARHMSGVGFKLLGLAMYPLTVSEELVGLNPGGAMT
jgi:NAD(P)-dependent dehydrogenase (short-subunit alcohol dehydrogenase family)